MAAALKHVDSTHLPPLAETEKLAAEITELCAYIYAATYKLLVLIREFDEQQGWGQPGLASCAHWLNFKCGIGMNAAREKVRVALALKELPKISAEFERGALSYSKVRAMTRIADANNEDYLLMIAKHGTAHHVEQLVSKYRRAKRLTDAENANAQHRDRYVDYHYDEDGCFVISGRLPAEQGALIIQALEKALDQSTVGAASVGAASVGAASSRDSDNSDVTAETPEPESIAARRADALAEVAEGYLQSDKSVGSTADRYQVVMHVCPKGTWSAEASLPGNDEGESYLDDGPQVTAETSRRIACDCSHVSVLDGSNGEPLAIGRKTRSIPPAIKRTLRFRDKGCRFPGCTNTRFVDGHHIQHWADGGETSLDNLVQLCRHHHRLVHEGGYVCDRTSNGEIVFTALEGEILPIHTPMRSIDENPYSWFDKEMRNIEFDAETCIPEWRAGEQMDWDLAVAALFPSPAR